MEARRLIAMWLLLLPLLLPGAAGSWGSVITAAAAAAAAAAALASLGSTVGVAAFVFVTGMSALHSGHVC